ncbi:MAG: PAS domain-containing protein, partial [Anaerolineales bacterium]|nr:PAS domain-containing protein [Anaerolineales bacterium]
MRNGLSGPKKVEPRWGAARISLAYLIIGALWIAFSDRAAALIARDQAMLTTISLVKGWAYIIVTTVALYWLIRRRLAALQASEAQVRSYIAHAPLGVLIGNEDGRFTDANPAAGELLGCPS